MKKLFLFTSLFSSLAMAAPFTYQGQLSDGGNPATGLYDLEFQLFDAATNGVQQGGTILLKDVPVSDGIFTVELDFGDLFDGNDYWLEAHVRVAAPGPFTSLTPRQSITYNPNAQYALNAGSASDGPFWKLGGNALAGGEFIGSGAGNAQPFEIQVNGQRVGRFEHGIYGNSHYHAPNVLLGSEHNQVLNNAVGATVSGGGGDEAGSTCGDGSQLCVNTVGADYATVAGGWGNYATGISSFVGGGNYNEATAAFATMSGGNSNTASGYASTNSGGWLNKAIHDYTSVGGGKSNTASGTYGTVGGGQGNEARATHATVSGGSSNLAVHNYTTVSGGQNNQALAAYSSVGGGSTNIASGSYAHVDGGYLNTATGDYAKVGGGWSNIASGADSSVGGGYSNEASALATSIAGGYNNTASARYAMVPGGRDSIAGGEFSFAAGRRAIVRDAASVGGGDTDGDEGTFVWADSTDADFTSTAPDQFLVRANGGMGVGTNSPEYQLHVSDYASGFLIPRDVMMVENTSSGTFASGLSIRLAVTESDLGADNNFITFFAHDASSNPVSVGAIEGAAAGSGVSYRTTAADFAEYLPAASTDLQAGEVVALKQGKLQRDTDHAERLFVISGNAAFVGNGQPDEQQSPHALAAFMGQVEVKISDKARAGDWLVASSQNDGRAVALSLSEIQPEQIGQLVGRALKDGEGQVLALVGLPPHALLAAQQQALVRVEQQVNQQQAQILALQDDRQELQQLRALVQQLLQQQEAGKEEVAR